MFSNPINLHRQIGQGDRSKFSFCLEFLPDPSPGCAPAEVEASWGRFQIWAGGRNLCAHYIEGVLYESVTWYLLPVLEWFAQEWDYLLHEQRLPYRNTGGFGGEALRKINCPEMFEQLGGWDTDAASCVDEWVRRHSLLMHRDGGLFPDVLLRRVGEKIEVSWTSDAPAGAPEGLQFSNGTGGVELDPGDVAVPIFVVLREAVQSLRDVLGTTKRIRNLERVVRDIQDPGRRIARMGILAGLGQTPADWLGQWNRLVRELRSKYRSKADLVKDLFSPRATESLYVGGECAGALMFASVSPTIDAKDALILAELLLNQADARRTNDGLREHVRSEPLKREVEPWSQGYALAQEWGETTKMVGNGDAIDIEGHLKTYGVQVSEVKLSDTSIGAVAIAHGYKRSVVAVNVSNPRNNYPTGRKFTLAHELCHLLYDRNRGVELQIVSGEWAPVEIEKRANAFAAGLLMPNELISRVAAKSDVDMSDLDLVGLVAVAKDMEVSPDALVHHLCNRRWINETKRDELLANLENRPKHESDVTTSLPQ